MRTIPLIPSLALMALATGALWSAEPQLPTGAKIFVAPNGDDASTEPGNPLTPVRTIQKAVDLVQPGGTVVVRGGVYRECVAVRKMATREQPILIMAYPGEQPVVSGTEVVPGPWKRASDGAWEATVNGEYRSVLNQDDQIFANGMMLHLARFPNATPGELFEPDRMLTVEKVVSGETLKPGHPTPWGPVKPGSAQRVTVACSQLVQPDGYWTGATLGLNPRDKEGEGWGFLAVGPILSYKQGVVEANLYMRHIGPESGSGGALQDITPGDPLYLMENRASCDANGEWYLDKTSRVLALRLPDGGDPATAMIEMKRRDFAFDLSDSAYVTVKGFGVFGATVVTDNEYGKGEGGGEWSGGGRGSNPGATGNAKAHHITIDGLHARYISHFRGTWGNQHGQWVAASGVALVGEDHLLTNSVIEYSAGNGVSMYGYRHRVINNIIHSVGYAAAHTSGIYISQTGWDPDGEQIFPLDMEIAYNTIYRSGWGLIDASKIYSSDPKKPFRIHHNYLDAAGLLTQDVGGVRLVGGPGPVDSHRNKPNPMMEPEINGTRIDHNIIRNIGAPLGNALYFDYCFDYICDNNLVMDSNSFVNINDCKGMQIFNNTGYRLQRGLGGYLPDPKKEGKSRWKDLHVRNNVQDRDTAKAQPGRSDPSYTTEKNIDFADLSEFYVNPGLGDFRLKPGSKLIDAGSSSIPAFSTWTGAAPDIGAIEAGTDYWPAKAGANFTLVKPPGQLTGTATPDGKVTLTWQDNDDRETGYVAEIGVPAKHNHPGYEYYIVARVPKNSTSATFVVDRPAREYHYRVRADRSVYSNVIYLASGRIPPVISFDSEQGYRTGPASGNGPWLGVDGGGPNRGNTDAFQIRQSGKGNALCIVGKSPKGSLGALGMMRLLDPRFVPNQSAVAFSLRIKTGNPVAGDSNEAARINVGGIGWWKSDEALVPSNALSSIVVLKNGSIKLTQFGSENKIDPSSLDSDGMVTVSGILDLAGCRVVNFAINGTVVQPESKFLQTKVRSMDVGLWQLEAIDPEPCQGVYIDDLSVSLFTGELPVSTLPPTKPDELQAERVIPADWQLGTWSVAEAGETLLISKGAQGLEARAVHNGASYPLVILPTATTPDRVSLWDAKRGIAMNLTLDGERVDCCRIVGDAPVIKHHARRTAVTVDPTAIAPVASALAPAAAPTLAGTWKADPVPPGWIAALTIGNAGNNWTVAWAGGSSETQLRVLGPGSSGSLVLWRDYGETAFIVLAPAQLGIKYRYFEHENIRDFTLSP